MEIDAQILPALARGCSVLGAGGGGDVYTGLLAAQQAIEEHGPVPVVELDDLPDDEMIMPCGYIGAPTVSIEKLGSAHEGGWLRDGLERLTGRRVAALMPAEIGGSNGLQPIGWAASLGLPITDADGMGRAFPEVPQVTMEIAGIEPSPSVLTDERGNRLTIHAQDGQWLERIARSLSVEFGGRAASTEYTMTVAQARTATARGTVTLAAQIGRAMLTADEPIAALADEIALRPLIEGKVIDVERRVTGGFVRGAAVIEGLREHAGRLLRLEIQNENLVAMEDGMVRAMVPDIIAVLDTHTGAPIHTERLRYGQRVTAVAFPCDPIWRTDRGLALAGPRAFGYEFDYVPIEELPR
jgi:uncharacterized protein